jgi:hypothetical protein
MLFVFSWLTNTYPVPSALAMADRTSQYRDRKAKANFAARKTRGHAVSEYTASVIGASLTPPSLHLANPRRQEPCLCEARIKAGRATGCISRPSYYVAVPPLSGETLRVRSAEPARGSSPCFPLTDRLTRNRPASKRSGTPLRTVLHHMRAKAWRKRFPLRGVGVSSCAILSSKGSSGSGMITLQHRFLPCLYRGLATDRHRAAPGRRPCRGWGRTRRAGGYDADRDRRRRA